MTSSNDASPYKADAKVNLEECGRENEVAMSVQKQREDRNSRANGAVGTHRKSMLPGRRRHQTEEGTVHSKGSCPAFPGQAAARPGREEKGVARKLVRVI